MKSDKGNAVYLDRNIVTRVGIVVAQLKADGERVSIKSYIEDAVKARLNAPTGLKGMPSPTKTTIIDRGPG
jgi:hypothetical protein